MRNDPEDVWGQELALISAGPLFKFNPSISFLVSCATKEQVDTLFRALSDGGSVLIELGTYPFSERYGWVQDRYGLSWQVMFAGNREIKRSITPMLLFVGAQSGKEEEAIRFYASVFPNSEVAGINRYGAGEEPEREGTLKFAEFALDGQYFAAMDSAGPHRFAFNEAISLMVHCDTQEQIDYYWERLSAVPSAEQCGWLTDKYGLSWQVVPTAMESMLASGDPERIARVTEAFLQMKKFDLAKLQQAFDGVPAR